MGAGDPVNVLDRRLLIVNADDLGMGPGVNEGVVHAYREGIVTSASLMVERPGAREAAGLVRSLPGLSVGLHVDLGEWVYEGDGWRVAGEETDLSDPQSVREAAFRQLRKFRALLGRPPTHLDSHQHVHLDQPARRVLRGMAARLAVPLRACSAVISYEGGFYGHDREGRPEPEWISPPNLAALVRRSPPGITELSCHPAARPDLTPTSYAAERVRELQSLCHPSVRQAIEDAGVRLVSFADPRVRSAFSEPG